MIFLFSVLFINLFPRHALPSTVIEKLYDLPKNHCIEIKHLRWSIVQKVSDHEYFAQGDGTASLGYAIIKTKKAIYSGTGIPLGISVRKVGSTLVTLSNGFTKNASIWKECNYDVNAECAITPYGRIVKPNRTTQKPCN